MYDDCETYLVFYMIQNLGLSFQIKLVFFPLFVSFTIRLNVFNNILVNYVLSCVYMVNFDRFDVMIEKYLAAF